MAEFPDYYCADPLSLLFPIAKGLHLAPLQDFPSELSLSALDEACKSVLLKDRAVLALDATVVIAVPVNASRFFSVALKIQKAVRVTGSAQFLLSAETDIYISQLPLKSEMLPPRLQQALGRSYAFPQTLLFKTWPRFERLTELFAQVRAIDAPLRKVLIYGPYGSGKRTLVQRIADDVGIGIGCVSLHTDERFGKIRHSQDIHNVSVYLKEVIAEHPASHAVLLSGFELLDRKLKISAVLEAAFGDSGKLLVASYSYPMNRDSVTLSEEYSRVFDVVKHLRNPNRRSRQKLFKELIEYLSNEPPFCSQDLDGLTLAEFSELAQILLDSKEYHQAWLTYKSTLQMRRRLRASSSEIPQVSWDEVAGLDEAKIMLKSALCPGSSSTGIVLYGPPGTGKTLLAKALATESRFSFLPVKGPELLNPYIGESEASLRGVFAQARAMAPCILFFDEIDALVPRRGDFGDSVGVADRLVSTFMTEMDRVSALNPLRVSELDEDSDTDVFDDLEQVFVIGATNRLDLVDSALLRPGRFDCSIFLGPPKSVEEQAAILRASCLKYQMAEGGDFRSIFDALARGSKGPVSLSPAEIALIAETAMRNALEVKVHELCSPPTVEMANDEALSSESLLIKPITVENLTDAALTLYSSIKSSEL